MVAFSEHIRFQPKFKHIFTGLCIVTGLLFAAGTQATEEFKELPAIEKGSFEPTWDSLRKYEFPEWFAESKFGIWAHWSPQCQPEFGDWYARKMYQTEDPTYAYHLDKYGHPSEFGFKDVIRTWKAEAWDPDMLIDLYQRAGAKYFMGLANHHCNFDLWNSTYQKWNSVNMGPEQDVVGRWERACRKAGLRFGISIHNSRSMSWYKPAHEADLKGPKKGVDFDGALTLADGKGTWWEGYDPARLYGPHGADRTPEALDQFGTEWVWRTRDVLDLYRPDIVFFDDGNMPFGDKGMLIPAHFYNASTRWNGGQNEAVITTRVTNHDNRNALTHFVERGTGNRIEPLPWINCTCIGDWHYNKNTTYKSIGQVLAILADTISKNGNLLLSIPLRGNGSIDEKEIKLLKQMETWMTINREAVFGTSPWLVFGENKVDRDRYQTWTSEDIRFTRKEDILYAIVLGTPADNNVCIRSLAAPSGMELGTIGAVQLLGHDAPLKWKRTAKGLEVTLPKSVASKQTPVLKIEMDNLKPVPVDMAISIQKDGTVVMKGSTAETTGEFSRFECYDSFMYIEKPKITARWDINDLPAGRYRVEIKASAKDSHDKGGFLLDIGDQTVEFSAVHEKSQFIFNTIETGSIQLKGGKTTVLLRANTEANGKGIGIQTISLIPE